MRPCVECGEPNIPLHTRKSVCSAACQNARRERQRTTASCTHCDRRMSYKAQAESPLCRPCRSVLADPSNRRDNQWPNGVQTWACSDCGVTCTRPVQKGWLPKWCEGCRAKSRKRDWIPRRVRLAIYEADGWTCWLCEESVDRNLIGSGSNWSPSVDHVIPRSQGGSNEPTNLRLAHKWCNTVRNDDRCYRPEDFRVSV